MTLTNNPSSLTSCFKHWREAYTNQHNVIDEIGATNGTWKEFYTEVSTSESDDVIDALVMRPFAAFFYGYWDNTTNDVRVQVVHHVNKNTVQSVRFDSLHHDAYGICGLLEDRKVVDISGDLFVSPDETPLPAPTPSLSDFKGAAGDCAALDALIPTIPSQQEIDEGKDGNDDPLPRFNLSINACAFLPMLMPAFGTAPETPAILLNLVLNAMSAHSTTSFSPVGRSRYFITCYHILQHLWLLSKHTAANPCSLLTPANLIPTETVNEEYIKNIAGIESVWIEKDGILPNSGTTRPILMDPALSRQYEALAAQNAASATQSAETHAVMVQLLALNFSASGGATSWKKRFHAKLQDFILFASATSSDGAHPEEPVRDFKQFLESPKAQSIDLAQQNINHLRNGFQVVDNAMAAMLYGIDFVNNAFDDHPRGLSLFCAVSAPVIGGRASMNGEELAIRKEVNSLSNEQIKKLSTPTFQVPATDKDLVETFDNHLAVIAFVFGSQSLLHQRYDQVRQLLIKHRRPVAMRCARDALFIPGLMATVDIRVQEFLRSCAQAALITDVDFSGPAL